MTQITNDMLTDWFPADILPARSGAYIVETINGTQNTYYCYWSGHWGACGRSPAEAAGRADWEHVHIRRVWRGLKEKAE